MRRQFFVSTVLAIGLGASAVRAGDDGRLFDLSKEKVLYCVGYAHLDTQWRWDFGTTIDRFIRDTLDQNFERFERYPGYVFNFTGSVRYKMMKEYYPQKYERLKKYIAEGRWFVSGSSVDEGDVNVPSAEAVIRQVLYGNRFFRREFGKQSVDYMLPDCFGFPASMPSIWAHCGLVGFSTQKLTWGSAVGIPFKIGVWEGPDGESVIAALDPGAYVGAIEGRVDLNPQWADRIDMNGRKYGVWADYHYYGVGDQGGAPRVKDVENYLASVHNPDSRFKVALVASDQMYKDVTDQQRASLPRYRGDLLLTEHSAGTLTSQSCMKRWNRKNELLADAAERMAVAAHWLGAADYPVEKLNRSWERVLASQMHDILPGTSIPRAYVYSWNDEIVAMNGFAAVLTDSVGGVSRAMDARTEGVPLIVYNPLAVAREDLVEATVRFGRPAPKAVSVFGPDGVEVPSQILQRSGEEAKILFVARVPSVSLTVFDVRRGESGFGAGESLKITRSSLENEHYRVSINQDGDVASIEDKHADRKVLASPAKLVFTFEKPANWPAWNMDWADREKPPIDALKEPVKVRIAERGPVRVALEIERKARNSIITQEIRLARGGAGRRIEFKTDADWQSTECALRASFPLTVSDPKATYNLGMGTIERGNNAPTKYEVPSREWFDLTDASGDYGVSVLEDCKFGSDKPADNEVRLTLLYTPGVRHSYLDQHSQDWGRHEFVYALYGHQGDWRAGRSEWHGRRLNQPLRVYQGDRHAGALGRSFSFLRVNTQQVDVRALKRAEDGESYIVRLQELWGRAANDVEVSFAVPIAAAYEVDGQERRIGEATLRGGRLVLSMRPHSPRSFAVLLGSAPVTADRPTSAPVALQYDTDVLSADADRSDGGFGAGERSIPAEMLPETVVSEGIAFKLGPGETGKNNALTCRGQTIDLPGDSHNRVYLLAAATEDADARFVVGGEPHELSIQKWTGLVGQWDNRQWDREFDEVDYRCQGKVIGITPGFIKRDTIAWFCTHRHHRRHGNEAYQFSYLFKYGLDLSPGASTLTLPDDERVKVFAITAAINENDALRVAAPLYDDFSDRKLVKLRHVYPEPPPPVFENETPTARVITDRQESFDALKMGAPVRTDYADQALAHAVLFRYFEERGEYRPHRGSGAVGDTLPRLNDGEVAQHDDDTDRCVWYDNEGRFYVDLVHRVTLERVNLYSWHRGNRAPQYFSLWGSNEEQMPSPAIKQGDHEGWKLIAVVNTKNLGSGGIHGSSITGGAESLGPWRYLLWVTEDVGQGTFFTEIDIHVAE